MVILWTLNFICLSREVFWRASIDGEVKEKAGLGNHPVFRKSSGGHTIPLLEGTP